MDVGGDKKLDQQMLESKNKSIENVDWMESRSMETVLKEKIAIEAEWKNP